jgi:carboxymethylenebutenolidase
MGASPRAQGLKQPQDVIDAPAQPTKASDGSQGTTALGAAERNFPIPSKAGRLVSSQRNQPAMNQVEMIAKWDEHISFEFSSRDVSSTIATMVEDAYVNHVPVMTGGYGHAALRRFYAEDFIPLMPSDTSIKLVSRTLGQDQLVDEMIFSFTHTEEMPWMLPGVPPTHRHVDIPLVVVVGFRDGKLAHERIYWDQASVLKQIGLLSDASLPVFGAETAQKVLDPSMP